MRNVLLQAFPSSWQEIVDVFRKLTEKLLENPRDQLGMRNVLLQAFPSSWQDIMDVFRKLTEKPSENPASEDSTRVLSHLLKNTKGVWDVTFYLNNP